MSTIPPEVAEAFASAAVIALQELVQLEVLPELANHDTDSTVNEPVVVATIQLLRDPPGSMSLVLTDDSAAELAGRYLPGGTALTPEMIDDVAGEFANVIAGQAKTMLKGTPHHFNLTPPTVVRADLWHRCQKPNPNLTIRVASELGEILLHAILPS